MSNTQTQLDKHKEALSRYEENLRKEREQNTPEHCDYMVHQRLMQMYHRGAVDALKAIEGN